MLNQNILNREKVILSLHEELIGPIKDFSGAQELTGETTKLQQNGQFYYYKYCNTLEEIHYGQPQRHYSAGMLYPLISAVTEANVEIEEYLELKEANSPSEEVISEEDESFSVDEQLSENKFLPSTFGFTFAVLPEERDLTLEFTCGYYEQKNINYNIQNETGNWWFRKSQHVNILISLEDGIKKWETNLYDKNGEKISDLKLQLDSLVRSVRLNTTNKALKIVTISATNITEKTDKNDDSNIMFQCNLKAKDLIHGFQPYPSAANLEANIDEEDKKFDLLYSTEKNYGFGQNCSTTWNEINNYVDEISTSFLPEYEIKTMTPDITIDGKKIEITHASLASAKDYRELQQLLGPLVKGYKDWFKELSETNVLPYYQSVFEGNLNEIAITIERIEKGIERLSHPDIFNCFRLVNLAMLMQMVTGKATRTIDSDSNSLIFSEVRSNIFESLDYANFDDLAASIKREINSSRNTNYNFWEKYKWRGFQIAFLLMSIESFVNKKSEDREVVDLIWFPTGGGKTEAYLGSAAFSMIYRRLINPQDRGTDIIMRYTLRLLTADQFQRSARLMCSLEFLRKMFTEKLGDAELSLGMWVGKNNTPNTTTDAKARFNQILRGDGDALFPISSCPWCGAEMTFLKNSKNYYGYSIKADGLVASCPDNSCPFHERLPIYFVDDQLYNNPPTFLIGTVDKFVQLTWIPYARSFFGIDINGKRIVSPPNLIIQDELHLISGPLGTLTGIYESLIEELCTDRRNSEEILPKIICATATIKAYSEQIGALFARKKSALFPPSGVNINDNYFSTVQKDKDGYNVPGRKYIGFHPFTQGRLQTEVQVTSSLLASAQALQSIDRDPFWTILSFYNTINDIGKALTLTDQDIQSTLKYFYRVRNIPESNQRNVKNVKELTSRLDSNRVNLALDEMKTPYREFENKAIDIVLASNIIEVGIDIDRLSLMTINGQPKTSAQYIQVSGRVGRRVDERPGLVVTEYNPMNSNDKSHYEHFIEYHQRLYSQVEESSVTPFSRFAIARGLPAVIIGFIRQNFDHRKIGKGPDDQYLSDIKLHITAFLRRLLARAERVDSTEINYLKATANALMEQLLHNSYDDWEYKVNQNKKNNNGFMVRITKDQEDVPETVLPVMFSMRSVDSVSRLVVTALKEEKEDWF